MPKEVVVEAVTSHECPRPSCGEILKRFDEELMCGYCPVHGTQFLDTDTTPRVEGGAEQDATQVAVAV